MRRVDLLISRVEDFSIEMSYWVVVLLVITICKLNMWRYWILTIVGIFRGKQSASTQSNNWRQSGVKPPRDGFLNLSRSTVESKDCVVRICQDDIQFYQCLKSYLINHYNLTHIILLFSFQFGGLVWILLDTWQILMLHNPWENNIFDFYSHHQNQNSKIGKIEGLFTLYQS